MLDLSTEQEFHYASSLSTKHFANFEHLASGCTQPYLHTCIDSFYETSPMIRPASDEATCLHTCCNLTNPQRTGPLLRCHRVQGTAKTKRPFVILRVFSVNRFRYFVIFIGRNTGNKIRCARVSVVVVFFRRILDVIGLGARRQLYSRCLLHFQRQPCRRSGT